jgi:hypothetical protein
MSLVLYKLTTNVVVIDDLGITLTGAIGTTLDLTSLRPNDVALSATGGNLQAAIDGTSPFSVAELVVVDPRGGTHTGNLDATDSLTALQAHNDAHIGVQLADLGDLSNVTGTPTGDEVLQYNSGTGNYELVAPSVVAGDTVLGDLGDVDDLAAHTADAPVIFMGDGTNFDTVPIIGGTNITGVAVSGTSWTLNVDDVFLKNTGDTLDSGTLAIAEGASLVITADGGGGGATLTIGQDANATIETPSAGFANDNDLINKAYVDAVAAGLDWKESAVVGTVGVLTGVGLAYSPTGGTGGTGNFTNVDTTGIDGVTLVAGDRLVVKNQADGKQNGIYVVVTAGALGTIERASDHDTDTLVNAGNAIFLEEGTQADTGWVISTDDPITLNTTAITWTQFSGTGAGNNAFGIMVGGDGGTATSDAPSDTVTYNGTGINIQGTPGATASVAFVLDVNDLTLGAETLVLADLIGVYDGTTTLKYTFTDVVTDLQIPNAVGAGTGFLVSNGAGAYTTRTIGVSGAGNEDGLAITGGDGSANTVIGLNILTNAAAGEDVAAGDLFIGYNLSGTANETFTAQEMADGFFSLAGGLTNAYASFVGGDGGTATAAIGGDTITINGTGINVTTTNAGAGLDSVSLVLDINDLTLGAETLVLADLIGVYDGTTTLKYTFTDVVVDLEIPNAIGTTAGFVVSDGAGAYTTRTITASVDEDEDGLVVTNPAGGANLTVGLDIVGMTDGAADLAATDEFAIHDKSEGTAGANRKITGQNVSDGVLAIAGLSDLGVSTINGQEVLTLVDATRVKTLSISETAIGFSENTIGNNDWVDVGGAVDALSGYTMPMNGTVVRASFHTSDDNNNSKGVDLYVDGVATSPLLALTATNGENSVYDETLNIDVNQGQKIRLRGDAAGGSVQDSIIMIWIKWRA